MKHPSPIATVLQFVIVAISHAIYLDIHVPLPADNCLMTETLRANELLRSYNGREQVDLFSRHTPHITLFLADFDLEFNNSDKSVNDDDLAQLNEKKVDSFLNTISAVNFTHIVEGLDCTLSLSTQSFIEDDTDKNQTYYTINGAFTMLNVLNTLCLKALSNVVLDKVESFVKRPIIVPSWVASLPEPQRSAAIYRSRKYGSPNVLEGFIPHLTVGFDPLNYNDAALNHHSLKAETMNSYSLPREDAMEQWNEGFAQLMKGGCSSEVKGIAVGKNGAGGTVLADSRLGYWNVERAEPQDEKQPVIS